MMFDDIIRFLSVFAFLLVPYALVFYAVFGGQKIIHNDYENTPQLCETALLDCPITEVTIPYDGNPQSLENSVNYIFNGTSSTVGNLCSNATNSCRIVQAEGFETFYSLLFSIFRIALVDDSKTRKFNIIIENFSYICTFVRFISSSN